MLDYSAEDEYELAREKQYKRKQMTTTLTPYKKLLTMTKEAIDGALAVVRAKSAKCKAELELAKLEENDAELDKKIQEACSVKELNFSRIIELQDEQALNARKMEQFKAIIAQMFPSEEATK
jgi:hypothetical protein